jgi:hypothetical protein
MSVFICTQHFVTFTIYTVGKTGDNITHDDNGDDGTYVLLLVYNYYIHEEGCPYYYAKCRQVINVHMESC